MEAHSAFEQGVEEAGAGDPFGDDGMGDFAQPEDPFADPPLVDREGAPVGETEAPDPSGTSEPADPAAAASQDANGEPDPTGAAESAAAQPPLGTTSDAADSTSTAPETEAASSAEPGEAAGSEDPTSGETGASEAGKKDLRRRYLVFAVEGPGKFAEVSWLEKKGEMVAKGTAGAKKQTVCLVHDVAEALAVGYLAVGSPPDGCALVAVAANYFRVRQVAPKVRKSPPRVPLDIS